MILEPNDAIGCFVARCCFTQL